MPIYGIKNVYTIGWDLIDINAKNITHYFEHNDSFENTLLTLHKNKMKF